MAIALKKEFQYYIDNQDELVGKYPGKFIVIKGEEIIGVYDSDVEALTKTSNDHKPGTFLIQRCESGQQNYTQVFHSRVAFG